MVSPSFYASNIPMGLVQVDHNWKATVNATVTVSVGVSGMIASLNEEYISTELMKTWTLGLFGSLEKWVFPKIVVPQNGC